MSRPDTPPAPSAGRPPGGRDTAERAAGGLDLDRIEAWTRKDYVQRGATVGSPLEVALRHIDALIAELRRLRTVPALLDAIAVAYVDGEPWLEAVRLIDAARLPYDDTVRLYLAARRLWRGAP